MITMTPKRDVEWVLSRIDDLVQLNSDTFPDRWRIRSIMNGGADGIQAVMAWDFGKGASGAGQSVASKIGSDMPTVNLIHSGLERTAQQLGRMPTLKPPAADDPEVKLRNQKKIDVLAGWDEMQRLELQMPQVGRWLPGYGFFLWQISQGRNTDGELYPIAKLRDPFDVHPGWFGSEQQPADAALTRIVPLYALEKAYPETAWDSYYSTLKKNRMEKLLGTGARRSGPGDRTRSWEGPQTGVEVVEYLSGDGTYICIPELEMILDYIPSPLPSGSPFVFVKRFSFDRLIGQYHHSIGLMSMMAKLNILGLLAAQDGVFRPTDIVGELKGNTYEFGRFAVNEFELGSTVAKPPSDQQQQIFSQIDRVERQLRIGANYDVQQDGQSPMSFSTGRSMIELQGAAAANIREYQVALKHGMEMVDAKRLEWADQLYGSQPRKYYDMHGKHKTYRAQRVIRGDYRTRRVYGAMATFDDAQKVVVGLQLLQAGIIDVETLRENIDGLTDLALIGERVDRKVAIETLYQMLQQESMENPAAKAALAEIAKDPANKLEILLKYFSPQEPQVSPEEEAAMAQLGPGPGGPLPEGGPESMSTVLSRVEQSGGIEGGVQTVGQF